MIHDRNTPAAEDACAVRQRPDGTPAAETCPAQDAPQAHAEKDAGTPPAVCERLQGGTAVFVSAVHRFGTDAMLLSHFCRVHRAERACDLGSGWGIIPLRWHDAGHRGATLAVELQHEAATLLQQGLEEPNPLTGERPGSHIAALCADLRTVDWARVADAGRFDVVSCNPPYFTGGFVSQKPGRAAARHQLSCTTADVARAAAALLRDGGRLCLCGRPAMLGQTMADCVNAGLQPKRLRLVRQRAAAKSLPWLFLLDCRKAGGVGLELLPDLIMEAADGSFSDEVLSIYGKHRNGESENA